MLSGYGKFLQDLVSDIYARLLRDGWQNDSYLKFIAFEQPEKLQHYLSLEGHGETSDQFLLRVLKEQKTYVGHDQYHGHYREVSIRFDNFSNDYISLVEVFKDLLHKISSVNAFLEELRKGNHQWDDSSESVDELRENIRLLK